MINDHSVLLKLLEEVEIALKSNTKYVLYSDDWYDNAPDKPGVYFVWNKAEIVYVGESSNLKERMRDLKDTRHHTLRRKIGKHLFSNGPNYQSATSKIKFPPEIEKKVTDYCEKNLKVTYVPLIIGRKEVEEIFIFRKPKYNSLSNRREYKIFCVNEKLHVKRKTFSW